MCIIMCMGKGIAEKRRMMTTTSDVQRKTVYDCVLHETNDADFQSDTIV